ncbi:ATP-binding protein [Actinocrispum sp. NPDC049592]|uniref:sensor histidine kinase n=1 Tax=Actinocrispum sp. NPDC049592 TaxID=3154835 RepID=UPI00343C8A69
MHTPFEQADESGVVGLHRQVRGIVAAVVVLARLASLAMVVLSVVGAVQVHAYTEVPLAIAVYGVLAVWSAVLITLVVRRTEVAGWVLVVDVAVTVVVVVALPWAVSNDEFVVLANPYLEPIMVSVAVAVALVSGSAWQTTAGCMALALAFVVGQAPLLNYGADVVSMVSTVGWEVGIGFCCLVFIQRLRRVARQVDVANAQVIAARERVAAQRAHTEERTRHFHEEVRRYRALHDGPLRILTAIAGPGPAGHPDPAVRRQCAVSVNLLRGAAPDSTGGTLTDLSLALMEAGGDSAALGLRVEYHFANLPEDLPAEVVDALCRASAEALSNVAVHAGTTRARLTAMAADQVVTVAIVDQGKGFDPGTTEFGYGIRHSVIDRMTEVGGVATVDSHPGEGTRIDMRWPA